MAENGRLNPASLSLVSGVLLEKRTAEAWKRMAAASPVPLKIIANGGYRSYATQVDMKRNPAKYGISSLVARLLAPAGHSPHGLGTAVDVGSFGATYGTTGLRRQLWVLAHMGEYGFTRPLGKRDPNHLVHNGTTPAGGTGTPIKNSMEDSMYIAVNDNNSNEAARRLLVTSVSANIITAEQSRVYVALGVPFKGMPKADWLVLYNDGLARVAQVKGAGSTSAPVDLVPILDAIRQIPTTFINLLKQQWTK